MRLPFDVAATMPPIAPTTTPALVSVMPAMMTPPRPPRFACRSGVSCVSFGLHDDRRGRRHELDIARLPLAEVGGRGDRDASLDVRGHDVVTRVHHAALCVRDRGHDRAVDRDDHLRRRRRRDVEAERRDARAELLRELRGVLARLDGTSGLVRLDGEARDAQARLARLDEQVELRFGARELDSGDRRSPERVRGLELLERRFELSRRRAALFLLCKERARSRNPRRSGSPLAPPRARRARPRAPRRTCAYLMSSSFPVGTGRDVETADADAGGLVGAFTIAACVASAVGALDAAGAEAVASGTVVAESGGATDDVVDAWITSDDAGDTCASRSPVASLKREPRSRRCERDHGHDDVARLRGLAARVGALDACIRQRVRVDERRLGIGDRARERHRAAHGRGDGARGRHRRLRRIARHRHGSASAISFADAKRSAGSRAHARTNHASTAGARAAFSVARAPAWRSRVDLQRERAHRLRVERRVAR